MKEKQAKQKAQRPANVGDVWTWTGIDADSKLIVAWFIGSRDAEAAWVFMRALASRLTNCVQLTTDGHRAYLDAVDGAFGTMIDYAMLVKQYGTAPEAVKRYSPPVCLGTHSDSRQSRSGAYFDFVCGAPEPNDAYEHAPVHAPDQCLSKKFENHCHMVALYAAWYNFVRVHKTLKVTPAMGARVSNRLLSLEDVVGIAPALPS